jgi:hypothetical protein
MACPALIYYIITFPEIIDQNHELILEERRISAKSIAEQLDISRERVGSINHEDLDMLVAGFFSGRAKDLSASRLYDSEYFHTRTTECRVRSILKLPKAWNSRSVRWRNSDSINPSY